MPKFKVGDKVQYKNTYGKSIRSYVLTIDKITDDLYRFNDGGCVDIVDAEQIGGDLELEYVSTRQVPNPQKDNTMYEFKTSAPEAIDFSSIHEELSRNNPICKVEFKSEHGERRYYVVVHSSLREKAEMLDMDSPEELEWYSIELNHPSEYADWVAWARDVKNAAWIGDKGVVTVSKVEI